MLSLIQRLIGHEEEPEPPADATERRNLEHTRRRLERRAKRFEKALDRYHCSTCTSAPVDRRMVQVSKELKSTRARIREIDERLAAG